jgi:hypothetical protein
MNGGFSFGAGLVQSIRTVSSPFQARSSFDPEDPVRENRPLRDTIGGVPLRVKLANLGNRNEHHEGGTAPRHKLQKSS